MKKRPRWVSRAAQFLLLLVLVAPVTAAQDAQPQIPADTIASLEAQLAEARQATSSARQKLAVRRVIRACEGLIEKHQAAPDRYVVLGVLFRSQQLLIGLDDTTTNRRALLETCRELAAAPNDYAAIRLDADLLLSQAELARQGADQQARADALKPLVARYLGTEVEAKVVRIAMLMALEFGDAGLIQHLRQVIAEQMPGDRDMINFQREKLAGQVFGAPFVGHFTSSEGKAYRLPMDGMGKTTALYFWSKEDDGLEQLKLMAEGWKQVAADPEKDAEKRYQFISFNLDGLPDAGESLLREAGLDWPCLHLPGGIESPIYKTYVRSTPKLLTMTPTGYTAMVMSGSTRVRPDRTWEQLFGSRLARSWAKPGYSSQMQSLLAGDFLVVEAAGEFDPAAPPEWKAVQAGSDDPAKKLNRTAASVPADKLQAIQACFVKPPMRYRLPHDQVRSNYAKAEALCRQAIAEHADADDLWLVRNRRIVALMGLWKTDGDRKHYDAALQEAKAAIEQGYPAGTDLVARFCLAREALRAEGADLEAVIDSLIKADGDEPIPSTAYVMASLLALEVGERGLHEHYRRASLDKHANDPVLWTATAFLLDRYHRYWLYHPPFTAGWTYGRRMGHFLAIGTPEDAVRKPQFELKTLDGQTLRIPEDTEGKWAVIEFQTSIEKGPQINRYGAFVATRPFEDTQLFSAVLDDDVESIKAVLAEKKKPDPHPTLVVPGGMDNPVLNQLGILEEDKKSNIVLIRPDGTIAAMLSGLAMQGGSMQNIIELNDEMAVDAALARGDLDEAKRLAFAHAPIEQVPPPDAPRNWKPKKLAVPHLRARTKVYMAMGQWENAAADAQDVYLAVNSKAGWLSMRTEKLEEIEAIKATIARELEKAAKP